MIVGPRVPLDLAIIGGGLSGLSAAHFCRQSTADAGIEIFEAGSRTGGSIRSETIGGYLIDHGADMFAVEPPAAAELCRDIGVDDQLIAPEQQRRGAAIWARGRMTPIPDGFVLMRATQMWPMMRSPLLTPLEKLRWLRERFVRKKPSSRVPNDSFEQPSDESVGDFVRRRMGRGTLDAIVAPLVAGIYTADIDQLSMRAAMGPIAAMEDRYGSLHHATRVRKREGLDSAERRSAGARYSQFRSFAGGMGQLIESLESSLVNLPIHTRTPVQSIVRTREHWQIQFEGSRPDVFATRVLIASPPGPTAKILRGLDPPLADRLAGIRSASAAIVCVGVHQNQIARPVNAFGFVVPPRERKRILAASFASHKFTGRAPEDRVLIRCFVGGTLQPEVLLHDDAELVHIVLEELAEMIGLGGEPELTHVVRWPAAMPQYNVGHLNRVEQIRNGIEAHPHLFWTSNAAGGVGISPTIASARRVTRGIGF